MPVAPVQRRTAIARRKTRVDALMALRRIRGTRCALLRGHLPWRGRRAGEIGQQLLAALVRFGGGLVFHRAVAAEAGGELQQLERGLGRDRRQLAEDGGDVLFVGRDQLAFELAIGTAGKDVERGAAEGAEFGEPFERRQHPGTERALQGTTEGVLAAAEDRGREVEGELEVAFELVAKLLLEPAV